MRYQTILAASSMLGLLPKLLGNYFGATPSAITTSFGSSARSGQKLKRGTLARCSSAEPVSKQTH